MATKNKKWYIFAWFLACPGHLFVINWIIYMPLWPLGLWLVPDCCLYWYSLSDLVHSQHIPQVNRESNPGHNKVRFLGVLCSSLFSKLSKWEQAVLLLFIFTVLKNIYGKSFLFILDATRSLGAHNYKGVVAWDGFLALPTYPGQNIRIWDFQT